MTNNEDTTSDESKSARLTKWEHQETIVAPVSREVAWTYWADMSNLEKEPGIEKIEIDGPFVTGTNGRTIAADGQQEWELTDVRKNEQFGLTGFAPDGQGSLTFYGRFEDDTDGTRITYRLTALGPDVENHIEIFEGMGERMPEALTTLAGWLKDFAEQ